MPRIFRMGPYWIYFWTNENKPIEPIHVHVSEGSPTPNATKIWITSTGGCILADRNSPIPAHILRNIQDTISARSDEIIRKWIEYFGEIRYFC